MPTPTNDLFAVHEGDPIREWTALAKELESFDGSLLKIWRSEYERWKHQYTRFREHEQRALFTATDEGASPRPSEQVMRLHRRSLLALLQSGEKCGENLRGISLDGDEAQERLQWEKRLRTLLDALQESLELWHPINTERIEEQKRVLFAR